MSDTSPQPQEEQGLSLGYLLDVLWRGRWIILTSTVICLTMGFLYVQRRGTIWRSTTRLNVSKPGNAADDLQKAILGVASKTFAYEQADALVSDEVLRRTLNSDAGADEYGNDIKVEQLDVFNQFEPPLTFNQKIDWLAETLNVNVGRDNEVISVSLDSKYRPDVFLVVSQLAEAFVGYTAEQRKNTAEGLAKQYSDDLQMLQKLEEDAGEELDGVLREQSLLLASSADGSVGLLGKIRRQEIELDELERTMFSAQLELKALDRGAPIWDSRLVENEQRVLQEARTKRAQAALRYTQKDPRLKALEAEVASLQQEYDAAVERAKEQKRIDLVTTNESAEAVARRLKDAIAIDSGKLQKASTLQAAEQRILRKLDRYRQQYEQKNELVNKITEQLATNNVNSFGVEIRKEANVERLEDVSGRSVRLALAMLLGLFSGAGITWLREMLDQRIRSADEASSLLGLPLLGAMPRVPSIEGEVGSAAIDRWERDPRYAEAARSLRTQVFFGLPADEGQVLQVTSPEQGDGKSTTISHLAMAMAKAGQRTLLIDADMRRPRQADMFRAHRSPGLSEVLAGQEADVRAVTQSSGIEYLEVLSAGEVPPNPAEMLNSEAFVTLIERLRSRYDRILIDSPPVLPVADASILCPRCDATLLVLRAEKSTRKRSQAAQESLLRVGGRMLGIILNDVPRAGRGRYYGGYGYYGSGYTQDRAVEPRGGDADRPEPRSGTFEGIQASPRPEELG